jgi:hypothetical protein
MPVDGLIGKKVGLNPGATEMSLMFTRYATDFSENVNGGP